MHADAYLIPKHYPAGKVDQDRLVAIKHEFAPLLGSKQAFKRQVHMVDGELITATPDAPTYYFPSDHPWAGRERYEWRDRGDGVKEGSLVEFPPKEADDAN